MVDLRQSYLLSLFVDADESFQLIELLKKSSDSHATTLEFAWDCTWDALYCYFGYLVKTVPGLDTRWWIFLRHFDEI